MRESRVPFLPFLLFLVASLFTTGYDVYVDNHALQLPIVDRLVNPSLYPGDPFVDTAPYYASVLWHLVAWASPVLPTMTQLVVLFVVERILLLVAFRSLARVVAPRSRLTELAAMAFAALAPRPLIADGTIVTSYLEQTGFSIPIFLLAVAAYLEGLPFRCALLLGLGFDFNSLYGTYLTTYLVAMTLADGGWKRFWPTGVRAVGVFLFAASPGILLALPSFGLPEPDRHLWLWASELRFSHHLYPLSWGLGVLLEFGLLLALVAVVAWRERGREPRLAARALSWCATATAWLALAFLAPVIGSPAVLIAHPGRACDFWLVLAAVYLISVAARHVEERRIDPVLGTATLVGAIIVWFVPGFTVVLAGVLAAAMLLAGREESALWRRTAPLLMGLVIVVAIALPVRRALAALSPRAAWGWRPNAEMIALTDWARRHTALDAVFLVPPTWAEFRPLAQRPVLGTWKDGAAILWNRPYLTHWIERMQALGLEPGRRVSAKEARAIIAAGFTALTDHDVRGLRRRFGVTHWVVPRGQRTSFAVVFESDLFVILSTTASSSSASGPRE